MKFVYKKVAPLLLVVALLAQLMGITAFAADTTIIVTAAENAVKAGESTTLTAEITPAPAEGASVAWSMEGDAEGTTLTPDAADSTRATLTMAATQTASVTVTASVGGDFGSTVVNIAAPATYAITYDANGGAGTQDAGSATEDVAFSLPTESTFAPPEGQSFKGWALDEAGTTMLAESYLFTEPATVYAIWGVLETEQELASAAALTNMASVQAAATPVTYVTVTFDANGGSGTVPSPIQVSAETYVSSSFFSADGLVAPAGSSFVGWSTSPTAAAGFSDTQFMQDTTLYAIWHNTITISFDLNGGTGEAMSPITVSIEDTLIAQLPDIENPPNVTPPAGKIFAGWSLTPDGEALRQIYGTIYWDSAIPTGDTVLYMLWRSPLTISFDLNGGSSTVNSLTAAVGVEVALPTGQDVTPPENQEFVGWALTRGGQQIPGYYTFTENTTLYALWANTINLTFDANGGSPNFENATTVTMSVAQGETAEYLRNFHRAIGFVAPEGQVFAGWSLSRTGEILASEYVLMQDTTLYAIWADAVTISFDTNIAPENNIVYTEQYPKNITMETRYLTWYPDKPQGKEFVGWSLTRNGPVLGASFTPTQDLTLYAIYADPIIISFDANGGFSSAIDWVVGSGVPIYRLPEITVGIPTGKSFLGWSTTRGGFPLSPETPIYESITLYAVWGLPTTDASSAGTTTMLSPQTGVY